VRRSCQKFLVALGKYRQLLEDDTRLSVKQEGQPKAWEKVHRQLLDRAVEAWSSLDTRGRRLLNAGQAWNMTEWVQSHAEWLRIETAGFFESGTPNSPEATAFRRVAGSELPEQQTPPSATASPNADHPPANPAAWGFDLQQILSWANDKGQPFGFSDYGDEGDPDMRESVFSDVERDVGALLAAATERMFDSGGHVTAPPPSEREEAVLAVIPYWPKAITGKEILIKLKDSYPTLDQGALTKDIIPKLKAYYGVANRSGVGYFRTPSPGE